MIDVFAGSHLTVLARGAVSGHARVVAVITSSGMHLRYLLSVYLLS